MIYYLTLPGPVDAGIVIFRFIALIGDEYYVQVHGEKRSGGLITITNINGGFATAEVRALLKEEEIISVAQLREKFGTFAQYLERIAEGFRSYISWIRPGTEAGSQWEFTS